MVSYHALDWDSEEYAWRRDIYKTFGVPYKLAAPDGHIIEAKRIGEKWVETGFDMDMEKKTKVDADRFTGLDRFMPEEVAKLEAQNGRAEMLRSTVSDFGLTFDFRTDISQPFNTRAKIYMLDFDIIMIMLFKSLGHNSNWPALLFYDLVEPSSNPFHYTGKWLLNHYESIWGKILLREDLAKYDGTESSLIKVFNDAFQYGSEGLFKTKHWIYPR